MSRALLVIDVQESFRQLPMWSAMSDPDVAEPVSRLVEHARAEGDLVVWMLHSEPGSGGAFDPVNGHLRLLDGLAPAEGEPTVVKTSHNAFTSTNLDQTLTRRGVRELAVCGIRTEQCCETTARVASDLGYDVSFITEATATNPVAHRDAPADRSVADVLADPLTLHPAEIIARTEYALSGRFASIRTVAEVTGVG
ncbi:cysteine hydrolase family protein [Saccharopolyspora dendranthemae]|uniref:Nicotinamidase-related amidase n=1 Tax=Saccharopolyspora dendranthemae TaxID=1181886 RepID=A0A561U734_9PSEU|nr:isochorismatase family protein [Saccharopolyspora dendranthemae]TWF95175.1 nicotinamidase-related amidase [Saccharopolyspora dendranthemae]